MDRHIYAWFSFCCDHTPGIYIFIIKLHLAYFAWRKMVYWRSRVTYTWRAQYVHARDVVKIKLLAYMHDPCFQRRRMFVFLTGHAKVRHWARCENLI